MTSQEEARKKRKEGLRKYNHSERGKQTIRSWKQSEKGKKSISKSNRKYTLTKRKDWLKTEAGKRYSKQQTSKEERERRAKKNARVSAFIRDNRLAKEMTQQKLADSIGIGVQAVRDWERGWTCPQEKSVNELSMVLAFPVENLIKLIEDREN